MLLDVNEILRSSNDGFGLLDIHHEELEQVLWLWICFANIFHENFKFFHETWECATFFIMFIKTLLIRPQAFWYQTALYDNYQFGTTIRYLTKFIFCFSPTSSMTGMLIFSSLIRISKFKSRLSFDVTLTFNDARI